MNGKVNHPHRRRNGHCVTCEGIVEGLQASFCNACRPYAGAVPYARLVAKAREVVEHGDPPKVLADALGVRVQALERRFYRHGDLDLAQWMAAARRATPNRQAGLAAWDPAAA